MPSIEKPHTNRSDHLLCRCEWMWMLCAAATTAMDDVYIAQSQEHAINSRLFSVYTCYKIHFAILLELAVGSGQTDRLSLLLVYNYPIHTRRLCGHAKSHEIHGIAFARVFFLLIYFFHFLSFILVILRCSCLLLVLLFCCKLPQRRLHIYCRRISGQLNLFEKLRELSCDGISSSWTMVFEYMCSSFAAEWRRRSTKHTSIFMWMAGCGAARTHTIASDTND